MTTYYVRTPANGGSDTAPGDGSTDHPWATVSKALATVSIGGGHTIKVGTGTYRESTSGTGYFYVTRAFSDYVVVEPESGNFGDVIISGNNHATYNVWVDSAAYIRFSKIDFSPALAVTRAIILMRSGNINHIDFLNCSMPMTVQTGIEINPTAGATISYITLDGCSLVETGAANITGVLASSVGAGAKIQNLTIQNSTVTVNTAAASKYAILIGADDVTGIEVSTVTISGNTITGTGGHNLLVGAGATGVTVSNNTCSGLYGIILKECTGNTVTGNTSTGGASQGAFRAKAATNCTITNNTFINALGGYCIHVTAGDTGNKSGTLTVTGNRCRASGTSSIFSWGDSTHDSGGCVCDYNTYEPNGTGKFGTVRADASVLTLAELIAAWSGYDVSGNDTHSGIPNDDFVVLMMARRR